MRCVLSCVSLLLLLAGFCSADAILPIELDPALKEFNHGRLIEAHSLFHQYREEHPEEPEALFFDALSKWKMMWLSTYNKNDRAELTALLEEAEAAYRLKTKEDKKALFIYSAIEGIRAQLSATEGDWWETAQIGKKMKRGAEDLIKKDPEYYEAYYLLGSFNYFADVLPGHIKFIRTLLFLPGGDREMGLAQLIDAYQRSKLTSGEAGRTLAIIYTYYERHYEYGLRMCDNLLTQYPGSFDIGLYKGINLYFSGDWKEAESWFRSVRDSIHDYSREHQTESESSGNGNAKNIGNHGIVPVYGPMEREIRFWISRSLIQQKRNEEAREILQNLAEPEIHQPWWLMRAVYLSLAQIDYETEHPEDAEKKIKRVLAWSDAKDSHDKARLLQKKKTGIGPYDIDFRN